MVNSLLRKSIGGILLLALLFLHCSKKGEDKAPPDVDIISQQRDSSKFVAFLESNHNKARQQIEKMIFQFLQARELADTLKTRNFDSDLNWILPIYESHFGIHDLTRRFNIYNAWDNDHLAQKATLDKEYVRLDSLRTSLRSADYLSELHKLLHGYSLLKDSFNLASVYSKIGNYYVGIESIDSADVYFSGCIKICGALENYSLLGDCRYFQARMYQVNEAYYQQSLKSYLDAINAFRKVGMDGRIALAEMGLGTCILSLYQTESAIRYFNSALEIFSEIGDTRNIAFCKYYLAEAFYDRAILSQNKILLDSSLMFADESLRFRHQVASKKPIYRADVGYSESCLALILQSMGEISLSRQKYSLADKIFREEEDSVGLCKNLLR
jgi:tetratricopeptide (TPR) repeat protein